MPDGAWMGKWYTFDRSSQRSLQFLIMRAQKPLSFSLKTYNNISLVTLIGVSLQLQCQFIQG